MNTDLLVVVGYIMHYDLLQGSINGSFFSKIDKAIELAEQFVELYPEDYNWVDTDIDFEEAIEKFLESKL
jgi:hypothetical protein